MTVWVFGDSFAEFTSNIIRSPSQQWGFVIAEQLQTELKYFGLGGTSLDYTYNAFMQNQHNIKSNDVLIFALTEFNRRWFWNDRPNLTCVHNMTFDNNSETQAYKLYELFLNNKELPKIYLRLFLNYLDLFSYNKNLHTIIMPCFLDIYEYINNIQPSFENLSMPNNYLFKISEGELTSDIQKSQKNHFFTNDPRLTHLLKSNHTILAHKLLNNIRDKAPLDFSRDFVTNQLNLKNLNEYKENELFNAHYISFIWKHYS